MGLKKKILNINELNKSFINLKKEVNKLKEQIIKINTKKLFVNKGIQDKNGSISSIQIRIGEEFNKEIEFIKDKRLELGIDKKRKSTKTLTNLIIKHNFWEEMKEDIINVKLERIKLLGRNIDE